MPMASKIEAMAERIAAINPVCKVNRSMSLSRRKAPRLITGFDTVLDCIDQVTEGGVDRAGRAARHPRLHLWGSRWSQSIRLESPRGDLACER